MATGETLTITLQSGETHEVTPVNNMIGQLAGYSTYALTESGDMRLVYSNVGEMNFQEKAQGGIMGNLERAMQIDDRSIREKYSKIDTIQNPAAALDRDRELYLMRKNNIEELMTKQTGVVWDEATGSIRRLDGQTACEMLNENVRRAAKQGVFGQPNAQGLYLDPANPHLPPAPLPTYSINNMTGMMQAGARLGFNQPGMVGSHGKDLSQQQKFAGNKTKKFGRLFGPAGGNSKQTDLVDTDMSMRSSSMAGQSGAFGGIPHMEDILRSQMVTLGANPNVSPNDPFYLSYANRREKAELNREILMEEQCDMSVDELIQYYMNLNLKTAKIAVVSSRHDSLMGNIMELENIDTKKRHFAKQITANNWHQMEIEIIRRMISTGFYIQPFEGFAHEPNGNSLVGIFMRKNYTIYDYLKRQTLTDDLFKRIFMVMLQALCHLESIGLHHPNLTEQALLLTELDFNTLKVENPFLYDNMYEEVANVYLNKFNSVQGKAAFNKRYLQENVMEMFLVLMSIRLGTNFSNYSPDSGKFNGPEILKGLEAVRMTCSPYVSDLLSRNLMIPMEAIPTPLQLSNQEGISIDYNSYFGHSKLNTSLYYPFEKFTGMKKSVQTAKATPPPFAGRIPHYSEIDYYTGDDLNESRMKGIEYRKNNFVVQEGDQHKPILKPYVINLKDADNNINHLIKNDSPLGNKNQDYKSGFQGAVNQQGGSFMSPAQQNWGESQVGPRQSIPIPFSPPFGPAQVRPTDTFSPITTPMAGLSPIMASNQMPRAALTTQIHPIDNRAPSFAAHPLNISGIPNVTQGARLEQSQVMPATTQYATYTSQPYQPQVSQGHETRVYAQQPVYSQPNVSTRTYTSANANYTTPQPAQRIVYQQPSNGSRFV